MPAGFDESRDRIVAELRSGRLTGEALQLVTRSARAIARTRKFTSPSGDRAWSAHDVDDLVGDFFASPGRLFDLATGSTDDDQLKGKVDKSLKRLIIDRLRSGEEGALRRRVLRRLNSRPDVVDVPPDHWAFPDTAAEVHWGGDDSVLAHAAARIPVAPPPWKESTVRRGPITDTPSVDSVCDAVLRTAAAPVERATVLRVVATRIHRDPGHLPLHGDGDDPIEIQLRDPGALQGAAVAVADVIWNDLDDEERELLADVVTSARELERDGILGLRKSALANRQRRLEGRLADCLVDLPDVGDVVRALLDRHERWRAGQAPGGAP